MPLEQQEHKTQANSQTKVKKLKTQNSRKKPMEKTKKLKEKTQNSRGKLSFSAYSYVGVEEKMAKL